MTSTILYTQNEIDNIACIDAVINGNLDKLKLLHQNKSGPFGPNNKDNFLLDRITPSPIGRYPFTSGLNALFSLAAKHGHLHILQWTLECDLFHELNESTCEDAAFGGRLTILQWLYEHNCPFDIRTYLGAAKAGHVHILQWVHSIYRKTKGDKGYDWCLKQILCLHAAKCGHLEALMWLRRRGFSWDEQACEYAAKNGYLEVLKWLRQNGCPWNKQRCEAVVQKGYSELSQWIRDQPADDRELFNWLY